MHISLGNYSRFSRFGRNSALSFYDKCHNSPKISHIWWTWYTIAYL